MNLADLKKPFPPERISWRVGSTNSEKTKGMALAYIDARDVMERLDDVCGVPAWQCSYPHANGKTVCSIGIKIGDEWIWKADGAGDSDIEAEKGALSDSFKRAAVRWGIGRYLYDLDSPWVALEPMGKSYKIARHEYKRLEALLAGPKDEDDTITQAKNWCDQQKDAITACKMLPDLTAWLDRWGGDWVAPASMSGLAKLKSKQPGLFNDLKNYYMDKLSKV